MKTLLKRMAAITLSVLLLPVAAEAAVNYHFRVPAKGLTGVAPWTAAPAATFWPVSMAAAGTGGQTTLIATSSGDVYVRGENYHGELGDGGSPYGRTGQFYNSAPATKTGGAAKLFAGTYQSYIVARDGSLWFAGDSGSGESGLGVTGDVLRWTQVPGLSNVVKVVGKTGVTFAITSDGSLWSSGNNFGLQRGMPGGTSANSTSFQKVTFPSGTQIVDVAVPKSAFTAIALDSNGNIWTAGNNQYGTLGDGLSIGTQRTFAKVNFFNGNAVAVSADEYAVAVLTNTGMVYTAGYNNQMDTGRGNPGDFLMQFGLLATGVKNLVNGYAAIAMTGLDGKIYSTSQEGDQATSGAAGVYPWSLTGFSSFGAGNAPWAILPDGSLWLTRYDATGKPVFYQYMFKGY